MREVSTITAKGQTTVPAAVRRALGVRAGDRIAYRVEGEAVTLHRVQAAAQDPVVARFLAFLETDMAAHPDRIRSFPPGLLERMAALSGHDAADADIDPDAPIEGEVAI